MIYFLFGLSLRSNVRIPGLSDAASSPEKQPDIDVNLGVSPARESGERGPEELVYVSAYKAESGEPALHIWRRPGDGLLHLQYYDGVEFWLESASRAWATWPASSSLEDAATYLLGPVLGYLLRFRGTQCLHASAVALAGRAVAFVGDAGAGKSTTAAAFAKLGETVVSDDIVAIAERDGAFCVTPAYPYLSLWSDSVALLYGNEKSLPPFSANFEKRMLSLGENGLRFAEGALPLGAIFLLGEPSREPRAPFVEELTERECLLSLVANSYATNLLDAEMRAREFAMFGRLVALVPVRRVRPATGPGGLEGFCAAIRQAYDGLAARKL